MTSLESLFGALGLARRAGALTTGHAAVQQLLRKQGARAVLVAADAGQATRRKFSILAEQAGVDFIELPLTKRMLATQLGIGDTSVMALVDRRFLELLRRQLPG